MNKFLNTALGSYAKVFGAIFLTLIVQAGSVRNLDFVGVFDAAVISFLPVLINYLNPIDKRYGPTKPNKDENREE